MTIEFFTRASSSIIHLLPWNSNTLATWCEELTHWKRPWCWEGLGLGGEGDDRGWDVWMASSTQWAWVWVNSRSCDGQGGLVCCSPWGHKESDTTEWLNWTEALGVGDRQGSHRVAKSQTRLSDWTELKWLSLLEKESTVNNMIDIVK